MLSFYIWRLPAQFNKQVSKVVCKRSSEFVPNNTAFNPKLKGNLKEQSKTYMTGSGPNLGFERGKHFLHPVHELRC